MATGVYGLSRLEKSDSPFQVQAPDPAPSLGSQHASDSVHTVGSVDGPGAQRTMMTTTTMITVIIIADTY